MSPLESGDPIIWMIIPFSAFFCEFIRMHFKISGIYKLHSSLVLIFLFIAVLGWLLIGFRINAIGILLSIVIIALSVDLRFGHSVFLAQIPTFVFATLACPSVSFWLDYYLDIGLEGAWSYLVAKFAIAVFFLGLWTLSAFIKKRYPHIVNMLFYCCVCFTFLFNRVENKSISTGVPLIVDTKKMASGDWILKRIQPSLDDRRFFSGCSSIKRATYFSSNAQINFLGLTIEKISNIHPIEICLKSSGTKIIESLQIFLKIKAGDIQVNEIEIESDGEKYMIYSWFSNDYKSTGDFRKFRIGKFSSSKWRHYQLVIPVNLKSKSNLRAEIVDFLNRFSS